MEPQEQQIYCYDNTIYDCDYKNDCKFKKRRNCLGIVATILIVAFALVLGLIIGAAVAGAILVALPAVIVLAVVLGLLFILTIILMICKREKCYK